MDVANCGRQICCFAVLKIISARASVDCNQLLQSNCCSTSLSSCMHSRVLVFTQLCFAAEQQSSYACEFVPTMLPLLSTPV
jgi:hypothetical protein